jgi:hypothetical protein
LRGTDANSQAPIPEIPPPVEPLQIVASGARLPVVEMLPARAQVRPGDSGIPIRVRVRYLPGSASGPTLERAGAELRIGRPPAPWAVRPAPENPTSILACPPPPNPCEGATFAFSIDVPGTAPPGPVAVSAAVFAFDRQPGGEQAVVVCGASDAENPASVATLEIGP